MTRDGPGEAPKGHLLELRAGAVAITTGAWSDNALKLFGLKNYSESVRRQICLVDNRATDFSAYGMIVDTSGVYFHNEGSTFWRVIRRRIPRRAIISTTTASRFFSDEIWPRMYARMSCCERLRHVTGWAGLYEVSPGPQRDSGMAAPRVYEAHSFSGRGVMQSYGAGQALAGLIAQGRFGEVRRQPRSHAIASILSQLVLEELHI